MGYLYMIQQELEVTGSFIQSIIVFCWKQDMCPFHYSFRKNIPSPHQSMHMHPFAPMEYTNTQKQRFGLVSVVHAQRQR